MKICTWNLMRPTLKSAERNTVLIDTLKRIDADIIILTETNTVIDPGDEYFTVATKPLPKLHDGYPYQAGENRVTILSKYPFTKTFATADPYTSVCAEVTTAFGPLIIYGTIIGFLGGQYAPFASDLAKQTLDLSHLVQQGAVCFSGDLNVSFSGYAYPSHSVREDVSNIFHNFSLTNLTGHFKDSAIHTVMSSSFLENKKIETKQLQFDKKITDHNLITVILTEKH